MLKSLIIAAVVSVVVWFAKEHLEDGPALVYVASDPIEIGAPQGRAEFVQEISVLNQGRSGAKAVSIKVPRSIASYQLHKHTNLAKEASLNGPDSFELLYPELPPEQRIVLFVRYEGKPVAREWIAVGHATGNAQPQEKQSAPGSQLSLLGVFWGGFLICYLLDLRRWRQSEFIRAAPAGQLFRNDRPWFAGNDWSQIQAAAICQALRNERPLPADGGLAWRVLGQPKPALISAPHWAEVCRCATEALGGLPGTAAETANLTALLALARLPRPEHLPPEAWSRFQESLRQQLFQRFLPPVESDADHLQLLPPACAALRGIPEPQLGEIRTAMQERYLRRLMAEAAATPDDPGTVLRNAHLDALSDEQAAALRRHVDQLARLRKMPESWDIAGLRAFLMGGRPAWMAEAEYAAIRRLVETYDDLEEGLDYLRQREQLAKNELADAERLRKHALEQLGLIDRVLLKPETVDTLDEYDQILPTSYRLSLERVARLLRPPRPTAEVAKLGKIGGEHRFRERGKAVE